MSDCKHEAALREASGLLVLDDPHNPIAYDWARVLDAAADHIAAQRAAIDRLTRERDEARAAIKDAYGEGWSDGGHSAESLYAGYGSHDFDAAWLASDAMRAADEALATEAAQ